MKVLIIEPSFEPREAEIESGLESLQSVVGGNIEAIYPYEDEVAIICNEEGRLQGLPYNLTFCGVSFIGTILVVGVAGDAFTGLDDRQVDFLIGNLKGRSSRRNAAR